MFCGCSTEVRGAAPNSLTCPVCLGLPGALPVINRRAVEHVLATGLAIGARIPEVTRWDRKNYFYPDLPKGYQISQYDLPLTAGGSLLVETSDGSVEVGITRAHLEEDTARLLHQSSGWRTHLACRLQQVGHPPDGDRYGAVHLLRRGRAPLRRGAATASTIGASTRRWKRAR